MVAVKKRVAQEPPTKIRYPESGRRMVALREHSGLTQSEFAASAGIAKNTWNQIEKGISRPSLENALRIVASHKVTLDWLFLGDDSCLPHAIAVSLAAKLAK